MNSLTTDIVLEITRAGVLSILVVMLVMVGHRRADLAQRGWWLILSGFGLLLLASVLDVTDNFPGLNRFVVIGDTPVQALLEKTVGLLGGFVLVAVGLLLWIPNITSVAELRESEQTNQALLEALPDLIMKIRRDGTYQWVHVPEDYAPVWGTTNPLGRSVEEMLPSALAEKVLASHAQTLATGRPQEYEYIAMVDGRINHREARVSRLSSDYVLTITRDITARKQTEQMLQRYTEELELARTRYERQATELKRKADELETAQGYAEQASQAKSQFLAHMSHEIRTPMTAILGYADILVDGPDRSEGLNAALTIKRNGEYLLAIINDILDLSKIEAGKLEIDIQDCSPADVVADVSALMRVRAEAKGLPLEVQFDGPIPDNVLSDPIRLRQILINLMGNAVKFTELGYVRLVTRLLDEDSPRPNLEFEVRDSGLGIPDDQISRLFTPFTQADHAAARPAGGTGLGLAISRRLAEMMGGNITVQSDLGQGSCFRVTVPTGSLQGRQLVEPSSVASRRSRTPDPPEPPGPQLNCHILLVEDGPDNQRLISFVLRKAGARVDIAEDGLMAVEMIMGAQHGRRVHDVVHPFDLVLMDMQMPVMDGYEATRTLRNLEYRGPIIALTAHAMTCERQKCFDAGCDDFATKPIERTHLFSLIEQYTTNSENTNLPLPTGP